MQGAREQPIFNAPGVVVGIILVLVAVHAGRGVVDAGTDNLIIELFGFNPARFGGSGPPAPGGLWAGPASFITHALLHADSVHLLVNSAWLLAVGTPVARRMAAVPFLAYFALCAAGGALFFLIMHPGLETALVGASGAVSGLMAAVFRLIYAAQGPYGRHLLTERSAEAARLSVRSMVTRRAPLIAIIGWVAINIVVALALGSVGEGNPIAWEAHLGGFFVGLTTMELFDRGNPEEVVR
jgi:membrane associated rhomboid family serine protease